MLCFFKSGPPPRLSLDPGVDLEPDIPNQGFTNVLFEDCHLTGNRGSGISVYLRRSDPTSPPLSVTFRRCTVDGATGQGGFSIGAMEPGAAMGGYGVVIEGSLVTNTTAAGLSVFDKAAHGPPVVVRDTSFVHAGPSKLSRPGLCRSNQHQQPNPLQPAPPTSPKRLLLTPSCNAL